MSGIRQVGLPEELCSAAEKKYGSQFKNVDELLAFALRELLHDDDAFDQAEQRIVEDRLRELGYI